LAIPVTTVSEANSREHWRTRHRRSKIQREATELTLRSCRQLPTLPVTVTLTRVAQRQLDEGDNLSSAFKAIRDQIAKHYGVDDKPGGPITWKYDQQKKQTGQPSVWLNIEKA